MSVFTNSTSSTPEEIRQYSSAVLELLGDREPIDVLHSTPRLLAQRLADLSNQQRRQPEAPGKWSVGEVAQHLADSELVGGFRFRMILAQDRPAITGYDQDLWAKRLHYDEADFTLALEQFRVLREANLRLIRRASPADLKRVGVHSERGEESLDLLIRLYAGHDLLHLRQVDRIRAAIGA